MENTGRIKKGEADKIGRKEYDGGEGKPKYQRKGRGE